MATSRRKKSRFLYILYWFLALFAFFAVISFLFIPQSHFSYILSSARLEGALAEKEYISNVLKSLREGVARRQYDSGEVDADADVDTNTTIKKIELRGQSAGFSPEEDTPFSADGTMLTVIEQ